MTDSPQWLDEAPCAYLVTSLEGRIIWANRTLAEWIGDRDADLVGASVHDLLTPGGSIHYEAVAPSLTLSTRLRDVALDLRRRDGTTLHLLCNAIAVPVGGRGGHGGATDTEVRWVGIDVTDRRAYERDLLVAQRRLHRLQDLSSALAGVTTVDDVGDALLNLLVDGVKADAGSMWLVDRDDELQVVAALSENAASDGAAPSDIHVRTAVAEGRPVFTTVPIDGAAAERRLSKERQVAVLPLRGDERLLGALCFGLHRPEPHTTNEQQLLTAAAEMCAQALERVQLLDRHRLEAERNRDVSRLLHRVEEVTTLGERAQLVADFVVPEYVDYVSIEIPAAGREPVGLRHRDPALEPTLRWLRSSVAITADQLHSLAGGRETRRPQLLNDIDEQIYADYGLDDEQLAALRQLAPVAYLGLPLIARGRVIGSMMLVQSSSRRRFRPDDVDFFGRLADACALTFENARLYEHERNAAQQLQTALLPERLPRDPRVRLGSFYEAGHELNQIGGDWFDAFVLDGDRLGLAVGDVVGGGLGAATAMAQLRIALQAYAFEGRGVADSLGRLDRFAATLEAAVASSVVYAELDLETNVLTYGCAGHPPPVLVAPGSPPELLWDGRCSLLGVNDSPPAQAEVRIPPGGAVVLYTDGLVERRGEPLDACIDALLQTISNDADIVSRPDLLAELMGTADHGDDTCVLTVIVEPAPQPAS